MKCCIEGCEAPVKYTNLCGKHYKREWRHSSAYKTLINMNEGALCVVEDCTRPAKNKKLCKMHYTRFWRYSRVENINADKGSGRPMTGAGYISLTIKGRRIYEHIYLAEKVLGR